MNEPTEMTISKFAETLGVELYKALELVKFGRTQLREDLIYWLNHPEKHYSNQLETPTRKIKINYKEDGFSLIWFDNDLKSLQMYSTGESIGKTLLNIKSVD